VSSPSGTLAIDCSSIHNNGTGVSANAGAAITQSDVFSNPTYDLIAPSAASADHHWWGAGGGKFGTTPASVITNKLASQQPVAALTSADDVLTATSAFAIGNMSLTADFSRKMTKDSTQPLAQFGAAGGAQHTLTGSWSTDETWGADPYALNLATATLGQNTIAVSGARSCVPDPATNQMATTTTAFIAAIEPTVLAMGPTPATYGGSATFSATLTDPGTPLANGNVKFILNGTSIGNQTSDNQGLVTLNDVSVAGINAGAHPNYVVASYGGDDTFSPSSVSGDLAVARAQLVISADDKSRIYADPDPPLTATATGLMNGDTLLSISVSPVLSTTATASSPVSSYAITVTGPAGSTNYAITYVDGALSVNVAAVTVTATSTSKVYGSAVPALM